MNKLKDMKKEAGFTMGELVVVLAAGLIILAAAAPALNTALDQYRIILSAQGITSQLQYARMKAVASNEPFRVEFVAGSNTYRVVSGTGEVIAGPFFLPRNISWNTGGGDPITFEGDFVTFLPTGNVPASGPGSQGSAKIVSSRGVQIDIQVSLGGMVRQSKPYTSGSPQF